MSVVNHNVVEAHALSRQAEEAMENKKWDDAVKLHQQAADLFLLATNNTQDKESIKALQLLAAAQSSKSKALLRQIQYFNSIRNTEITTQPFVHDETKVILEPMDEMSLSSHSNEKYFETPQKMQNIKQPEKSSSSGDLWGWIERMLQLLPDSNNVNRATETSPVQNSSLMSSFYFVPTKEETTEDSLRMYSSQLLSSGNGNLAQEQRIRELESIVQKLTNENDKLKKKLQNMYVQGMEVSKENDYMKKSILRFKQEFKKKAHQLREKDISSSVGDIQYYTNNHATLSPFHSFEREVMQRTIDDLRNQVTQLTLELKNVAASRSPQQVDLVKQAEPVGFHEELKQPFYSPPILTNSPPLPSSLTNSLILDQRSSILSQNNDQEENYDDPPLALMSSQIIT